MPWKVSSPVKERMEFVVRLERGERMTDLCREYGISRKTGYKFWERYQRLGIAGLPDASRAPRRVFRRISPEIEALVVETRQKHPTWGSRKLQAWLSARHEIRMPAASSITLLLRRHGLVKPLRWRNKTIPLHQQPLRTAEQPNDIWCADYKGQFRLGNGFYCYPLTITDLHSRFLLACDGYAGINIEEARRSFELAFREYGMPRVIRTDNGVPFASRGIAGLSRLSTWWLRLGIYPERIAPAHPEQNGQHERMHRTLKQETTRPAAANCLQQQERFDLFRHEFNTERPHEALQLKPPASKYSASPRPFPTVVRDPEYPLHDVAARVCLGGRVMIPGAGKYRFTVGDALAGEVVGLREVDEARWLMSFGPLDIAYLDFKTKRAEPLVT